MALHPRPKETTSDCFADILCSTQRIKCTTNSRNDRGRKTDRLFDILDKASAIEHPRVGSDPVCTFQASDPVAEVVKAFTVAHSTVEKTT